MRLKWILGIIAFLIVAVIVTLYAILSTYDFNSLKPEIAKAVRDATGHELRFGGDIDLEIGLTPVLVVQDVGFQNAPWGSRPDMAIIKRFEIQVALLPLIGRNIEVKRLILIEPDILIETDVSGRSNLDLKAVEKAESVEPQTEVQEKETVLPSLTFNQVRIDQGLLTYRDGKSGKTYSVKLESMTANAESADSPIQLATNGSYNDEPFEVTGNLGAFAASMDPERSWPIRLTAKAGGATVSIDGMIKDAMHAKGLDITVTAEGGSIPDVAKLAGVNGIPDVGPFRVVVTVSDHEGKMAVKDLDVHIGTDDIAELKITGSVKDLLATTGIDLNFSIRGKEIKNIEKLVDKQMPIRGQFDISGHIADAGDSVYKASGLKFSIGDNEIKGSAEIGLAGERPRFKAEFFARRLDLRSFSINEEGDMTKAGKSAGPAEKKDKIFPQDPLPLDILKQADADIRVRAGKILLPRIALDDLTVNMVLDNGRLMVKKLNFVIGGGTLNANLDLRTRGKTAIMKTALKVEKLDIGRMLRELKATDIIESKIDLELDLNGRGGSIAELMAGLNGKIILISGKGRIKDKSIDLLGADLSSNLFRILKPSKKDTDYTELNCLVSRFDIKDGIAECTALVFDTSLMSVVGEGKVNLRTEELDISVKPSPKKGLGVSGVGKLSLSLGELAKPLKLKGKIAKPSLALDPTQTAISLGKAIGGVMLFGPIGIAAVLAGGSSDEENPCLCAIESAKKGVKVPGDTKREQKKIAAEKSAEGISKGVKDAIEGIGGALKDLFKR
ncbi:MAG: AsmA family protein [Deltaproteobacteria bacterium]|nr:AsmA family protein [Deltaproteobacteria bacterium]